VRKENDYERRVIAKLMREYPGAIILKNDPRWIQGIPDRIVLYGPRWAALEIKRSEKEEIQPNQPHYVDLLNLMSYAAFLFPQNEEEVFRGLQRALRPG
jgi:hypothetical protein